MSVSIRRMSLGGSLPVLARVTRTVVLGGGFVLVILVAKIRDCSDHKDSLALKMGDSEQWLEDGGQGCCSS